MSEVVLQGSEPDAAADGPGGEFDERALRVGDVIADKYTLVSYLARGGMAEVWLATHRELKTEVAIKFVHEHLATDDAGGQWALERFRFEAQISARLAARTKHIVAVLDAGTHEAMPYLVMEYVPGVTLEAEVEQSGPLTVERFADLLDQVGDALDAAHALGIVHRDLKPSNFLINDTTSDGGSFVVKVADFGVAKAVDTTLAVDRPRETQRGEVVGSPAFMSPEQLRGVGELDARCDIWSLGVVTYEMLTGHECFEGKTIMDTFAAISMRRYKPPSTVREGLPRGLDAWIERALAESPADRFQTVGEMARAFRALLAPPPRRKGLPLLIGAAAAALVIGLSAAFVVHSRADTPKPLASPSAPAARSSAASAPPSAPTATPPDTSPTNTPSTGSLTGAATEAPSATAASQVEHGSTGSPGSITPPMRTTTGPPTSPATATAHSASPPPTGNRRKIIPPNEIQ